MTEQLRVEVSSVRVAMTVVDMKDFRERVKAFTSLFRRPPVISIRGIFVDQKGEQCFLQNSWHDVKKSSLKYFNIDVDGTDDWVTTNYGFEVLLETPSE